MVLMHTMGLVIYIQFEGVLDIRYKRVFWINGTQLHNVKSKTCVCMCLRYRSLFKKSAKITPFDMSNYVLN